MIDSDKDKLKIVDDPVSQAYHALEQEGPSADVDAIILKAANAELEPSKENTKVPKWSFSYQPYAVAASVFISVLLGNFIVNYSPKEQYSSFNESSMTLDQQTKMRPSAIAVESSTELVSKSSDATIVGGQEADTFINSNQPVAKAFSRAQVNSMSLQVEIEDVMDYRNSSADWILQIHLLQVSGDDSIELEQGLFQQRYPNIDLESALLVLDESQTTP